jgi:1-hydroxycarotenoid 3,4-desaturase
MGGLASALTLAGRAHVTVIERRSSPGGKMREAVVAGRAIDIGPTVLTMKWVFDELFARAGADFDTEVPTERLSILARHGWRDGSRFDLFADDQASVGAVAAFSGTEEAARFSQFLNDARRIFETLRDSFLKAAAPDMARMMRAAGPFKLLKIDPFTTYWTALGRYFKDPRLRQLFARYATYCGSSPFEAPATLMLIAHVEKAGVWAPRDGMAGLARATARLAASRGAVFRYTESVNEICVEQGRVTGVITGKGERLVADAVVVNGDVAALGEGLFGAAAAAAAPPRRRRSQSALTFTFSAEPSGFPLDRHNVFFSNGYKAEFDAVFDRKEIPAEPTTYIWAPPAADAGLRPLFCLINAPAVARPLNAVTIDMAREHMIALLRACGLSLEISSAQMMAPADFARDYPGTDGAIYGAPSHGWRATFERPGVRTRVPGLYLAGGSVHPGPGVPMAALSGMAAATCLMSDFGLT